MKTEVDKLGESIEGLEAAIDLLIQQDKTKARKLALIAVICESSKANQATVDGLIERILGVIDGETD